MKAYTDLEQSKKLAKILPIESADMYYSDNEYPKQITKYIITYANVLYGSYDINYFDIYGYVPCWSLAALLDIIPKRIKDYNVLRTDISDNDFAIWYDEVGYGVNKDLPDIIMASAVDACYEMILKLHELNLL